MDASEVISAAPSSDYDPYTDAALLDPWLGYRRLRDAGPAVWLTKHRMFALTRYDAVRRALLDWESFPSRYGVMMNDEMNRVLRGNTLCSDGSDHDALRDVLVHPLTPRALRPLRAEITAEAEVVVEKLIAKGTFDAATELAHHLPVTVVSNLVGLPEQGRERMLNWAHEMFNCFGPMNPRAVASFPVLAEMMEYVTNEAVPGKLKPGSWAERIHDAVDRGEVPPHACPAMMVDYMGPSLDTTIYAISTAVWLFANHPDQWDMVRDDPRLCPARLTRCCATTRRSKAFPGMWRRTSTWKAWYCPRAHVPSCSTARRTETSASTPTRIGSMCSGDREIIWVSVSAHTRASA
jgi:cytochrome P450